MIISKISHTRYLSCSNLLQKLIKNDTLKIGLGLNRVSISSSNRSPQSTPSLNHQNDVLPVGSSTSSSIITNEYWPNLLFTDDTWSDVDDNGDERFNKLSGSSCDVANYETPIRNLTSLQILFAHPYRENMIKIVMEELDLEPRQADIYVNFLRIKPISKNLNEMRFFRQRRDLLRLLKCHIPKKDIVDAFELFALPLKSAHYRISFLKECGFKLIKPAYLLNFAKIREFSEATLKQLKFLDADVNVVDSLLSNIPDLSNQEASRLQEELSSQGLSLSKQYGIVVSFLLKKTTSKVYINNIRYYSRFFTIKGLNILSRMIKDYSLVDSYTSSDLQMLYEADPHNLELIINRIPNELDENTLLILLKYPKILLTHSSTLISNLKLLRNSYGFTNEDIDNHSDCLMVETKDLEARIEHLISIFGQPNALMLSLTHLDFSELTNLLREIDENGFSSSDITSVFKYQTMKIKSNKYNYGTVPVHLRGLNRELGIPQSIILRTLYRHPHFHLMDNHKIKKTYNFIKNLDGITDEQVLNGLTLCLYDLERIKDALDQLKERDDYDEWRRHPFFLEALIYLIEKTHSYDTDMPEESNVASSKIGVLDL